MGSINILGIGIDNLSMKQTVQAIDKMARADFCHQIATVNPEFLVEANKNKQFRQVLLSASLRLPDGAGLLWAARRQGKKFIQRVAGADVVEALARRQKYSLFLLGGREGVAQAAGNELMRRYPRLKILGAQSGGRFSDSHLASQKKLIEHINLLKPDILLVGLGAPKQDFFIARWKSRLKCRVAIGVGGTLDYYAGTARRAPHFMQKLNLEWLWRLWREPSRLPRIFKATVIFPLLVLFQKNQF